MEKNLWRRLLGDRTLVKLKLFAPHEKYVLCELRSSPIMKINEDCHYKRDRQKKKMVYLNI